MGCYDCALPGFRHLLEENHLGEPFFVAINRVTNESEHIMHGGTIVDATIIEAPSSTKNAGDNAKSFS